MTAAPSPRRKSARAKVPRRRLPAEQRKQQIAFTAQKMFIEAGRDSVSMQSIADTAGVNIALLYRHFRSNVELYQAAVIEPLVVAIQEAVSTNRDDWPADAESRFTLVHQSIMEFVRTSGPLLRIALFSDGTSAREFYSKHIVPLLKNWVEPMLQEVADAGNLDLDIQATAVATFGAHLTFVLYPDASEDESASADIAGQLASLHWRGLSSR